MLVSRIRGSCTRICAQRRPKSDRDWKENRATRNLSNLPPWSSNKTGSPLPLSDPSRLINLVRWWRATKEDACLRQLFSLQESLDHRLSWRWKSLASGNSSTATMRSSRVRYFVKKERERKEKGRKKAGRRWRALQGEKMAHRGASGSRLPWMSLAFDRLRRESAIQFYNYEIANGAATLLVPLGDASAFSFGASGTSSVCLIVLRGDSGWEVGFRLNNFFHFLFFFFLNSLSFRIFLYFFNN